MAAEHEVNEIEKDMKEFQLGNGHIGDPGTLKDMAQSLRDLEKVKLEKDIIFNF